MATPIETPRLRLRPLAAGDAAFILELVNDPDWLRFIGDRNVRTTTDALGYIGKCHAMLREFGVGSLAVELKATGEPLGICGLIRREQRAERDLGFAFLARARGHGYAREAAGAMLRHGHATLGLEKILALTHPENAASQALLRHLGFVFEHAIAGAGGTTETHVFAHRG